MKTSKSHWPLTLLGGVVSLMNVVFPFILVRILGVPEVGHYKIFFLYLVLVPWFCMTGGLNNGLGYWGGRDDFRDRAFRNTWTLLLAIASVILALGAATSVPISKWLEWSLLDTRLFVWGAFVTLLANFFEDTAVAQGQIWRSAVFSSSFEFLRNVALIVAAVVFRNATAVFIGHIGVLTLKTALGTFWGYREGTQRLSWSPEIRKAVVRYAFPVSISAGLLILLNYADQLILSRILDSSKFAIYSIGCLTVPPLYLLEQSVTRVLIPKMSHAFDKGRPLQARDLYRQVMSELAWIIIPCIAGMYIFAQPIIVMLFTSKYVESTRFLEIYAFTYILIMMPYDSVARARGDGKWILRQLSLFALTAVPLAYYCGIKFGAAGVLLGMFGSQFVMRTYSLSEIHRREKWAWKHMVPFSDMGKYLAWSGAAVLGALAVKNAFGGGTAWFLGGGMIFSIIYMLGTIPTFLRLRGEHVPRKSVILLTQYLGVGGLERVVLNLAAGLVQDDKWLPTVFVYDKIEGAPTLHREFAAMGVPVVDCYKDRGVSIKVVRGLMREIFSRRSLVIHSHDLGALIYAVLAKWATLGTVRIVHTQHSFIHLEKSERYKTYEKFFTFFVDEVTTVSEALRNQYKTVNVDPAPIKVIPNGVSFPSSPILGNELRRQARLELLKLVPDPAQAEELRNRVDQIWVLCMARIHPKKGQDQIIKVWDKVRAETKKNATLIFVGQETFEGQLAKFLGELKSLNAPGEAFYAGFTRTPAAWLQAADIFVSGSEFEGMPLGPIEAVGAGNHVMVTDIPGHSMLPQNVERYPLEHPQIGAEKLELLIASLVASPEQMRQVLWSKGADSRREWGIERMSTSYRQLYETASNLV